MAQAQHDAQDAYNRYLVNTHGIDPRSPKAREANKKLDKTLRHLAASMLPPTHPGHPGHPGYRAPPAHPRGGRRKTRRKTRRFHGGKPPGTAKGKGTLNSPPRDPVPTYTKPLPYPGPNPDATLEEKTRGGRRKTRRSRRAY